MRSTSTSHVVPSFFLLTTDELEATVAASKLLAARSLTRCPRSASLEEEGGPEVAEEVAEVASLHLESDSHCKLGVPPVGILEAEEVLWESRRPVEGEGRGEEGGEEGAT